VIGSLGNPAFDTQHPNVRQIEPWRDGRQLAALLESAFAQDAIDASGHRMIDMLRNYGQFEPMTFGFGTSFVWAESGRVLGNASIQRNPTRRDTWIIGNVATDPAHQGRGIGRTVVDACVRYATSRGARHIALQVDRGNTRAQRLYERAGFYLSGEVHYYMRRSVRQFPVLQRAEPDDLHRVRGARRADRDDIWNLSRHNIEDALTYSEPFDAHVYRIGLRWSFFNTLNGNPEKWWVLERLSTHELLGAIRTRVNIEGGSHHAELMLREDATEAQGEALLITALSRFEPYISRPVFAAQALPHPVSHAALQRLAFEGARKLVHMRLDV
jgi:ribosomal protein S18 acetylase RimI-like enzyme